MTADASALQPLQARPAQMPPAMPTLAPPPAGAVRLAYPSARRDLFARMARGVAPRQRMTVSEWADAHRIISRKQGAEDGEWRTARNPLLREPMDALGEPGVVALMFPIQLGKSEILLNDLGYTMTQDPCPVMFCYPSEVSLKKGLLQKIQPMLEETPAVRAVLTSVASREASNTQTFKDFAGGQLWLEHAGSPARLKSNTVRKLRVDELDEFAVNLVGGDDPVLMLDGRTSAYPGSSNSAYVSTPQLRATSRIIELFEKGDQRHYHVPCPHCGERQPFVWAGLKWSTVVRSDTPRRAWYVCRECGGEIQEYAKTDMMAAGQWVPHNPGATSGIRSYTANCLYYPLGLGPRWATLAQMWLDVQGDQARLKTFINDRLAEPWEDKSSRNVKPNVVAERAEAYPLRTAPAGVLAITAGSDTQGDRLEIQIVGWGRGGAFWVLDYVVLPGDPALPDVWAAAADLLGRPIQHACGALMNVEATSFDMLGNRTEHVKHFVRERRVRRPMASFGATQSNAPVLGRPKLQDVTWRGKTDKRGIHVYQVGTIDAKHALFAALAADHDKHQAWLTAPDSEDKPAAPPLQCHFSADLPDGYFPGLISEVFNPSKNRFEKRRGGVRNEPLDTWVHAYAAKHHPELRLHRFRESDWARREAELLARAPKGDALQVAAPAPDQGFPADGQADSSLDPAPPAKPAVWHNYRNRKARP